MTIPRTLAALELADAGLVVARAGADGEPRLEGAPSPGYAVLHEGRVLVGVEAERRARLAPLHAQNRHWAALGLEPLPWQARGVQTVADLAHAHLGAVLAPIVRDGATELLLAVPAGYTRDQLGLLVGIAQESGIAVRGLVDLGLASLSPLAPVPHAVHLDLQLHRAVATLLEVSHGEGLLRRSRSELLAGTGVLAFRQALAETVAAEFVRATRFDPLHEAATEQRLYDRLPAWLDGLAGADEVDAEIESAAMTHRVVLPRQLLHEAIATLTGEVLRLVQSIRPPGRPVRLAVTPRVAQVPGLVARLGTLRDVTLHVLEEGAAALGALQFAPAIVRPPGSIALVHRLPLPASAAEPPDERAGVRVPADEVPTHVLFHGRAWPLAPTPLTLGWSPPQDAHAVTLPPGIAGVSRSHCALRLHDGQALVEDHSTYGTWVNDERVGAVCALRVGDVLRLGAPGVTLELIRVLPGHGAA